MTKDALIEFMQSQRAMAIASSDDNGAWITNVFFGADDHCQVYFVSGIDKLHSRQIIADPKTAFSTIWYNPQDHQDRKGVQGVGQCRIAESGEDIAAGVKLHNQNFPEFKDRITTDYINSADNGSKVWVIEPDFIKFWNDEAYGLDGSEEFKF